MSDFMSQPAVQQQMKPMQDLTKQFMPQSLSLIPGTSKMGFGGKLLNPWLPPPPQVGGQGGGGMPGMPMSPFGK